jgi:hypothetical protein
MGVYTRLMDATRRLVYVKDLQLWEAVSQVAREHGVSMSQLVDALVSLMAMATSPAQTFHAAAERTRSTFAELSPTSCDHCESDAPVTRIVFEFSTGAMSIGRFCEHHAEHKESVS